MLDHHDSPHRDKLLNVQPPRREDLQPQYAQTLHGEDASDHGWYGSMSMSSRAPRFATFATETDHSRAQSTLLDPVSVSSEPSPAASSAPTPIDQSARVMSVWSPSSGDSIAPWTRV